jgi:hypothetical protein
MSRCRMLKKAPITPTQPQARQDALLPELCSWLENPQRTDGKEPVLAGSGLGG